MTRQLIKGMTMMLMIVALSFVTAVVSANGQSNTSARADIPFEFVVGSKTLAAGHYNVSMANSAGNIVRISASDTNETAMRLTINMTSAKTADKGKLVFRRYANRYFLAEIWSAGEKTGLQLLKSNEEKAVARELASIQSKTEFERIEVALVRR